MNNTQHPRVTTYLDDLARMLGDLPPADRAEVLAGVREHIEAGLAERGQATDADVAAVLSELGPPDTVAREAYDGMGGGAPARPAVPGPPRFSDQPWVPVVVAILQGIGLLILTLTTMMPLPWSLVDLVRVFPLWVVVALFLGGSSLWSAREKMWHLLLLPAAALALGALIYLGQVIGTDAAIAAKILVIGAGGWLLVRLTRAGRRRAAEA